MKPSELRELARLYSIQLTYDDASGKKRTATREALAAVLEARTGTPDLSAALRARREELANRLVEPVTVVWHRRPPSIALHPSAGVESADYELTLEDGDRFAGRLGVGSLRRNGARLEQAVSLPHILPLGYHSLRITVAGKSHETLLIHAPATAPSPGSGTELPTPDNRPPTPRFWGAFLPLYAARTDRSWAVGDLGDLEAYRQWINSLGGRIVATLPMLASFEDEPSPYSPISRLFWNELYLDVEQLPEFDPSDRDDAAIARLSAEPTIDYRRINRLKRRALERMSERFRPDPDFEHFAAHASDFAEFRAHRERELRSARADERPIGTHRYHLYVQHRMAQQMRAVAGRARRSGPGLYLDFPLGVNPDGYDVWRFGDHFAKGVSVGAPPDPFFTKGQNWGFPPPDPDAIRRLGHQYFRACVRHHVEHAGILRIDHVMGLHRLYCIPSGADARDGVYVRYPEDELYAVLLLEASRAKTALVGEDLGTVPAYVSQAMARHGLRTMHVLQYEIRPEAPHAAYDPPRRTMASLNTHDMPPFAAFWSGEDIDDRLALDLLDGAAAADERTRREEIRRALTRLMEARGLLGHGRGDTLDEVAAAAVLQALLADLAASDAEMVLVNLEDLWLERRAQNVPGVPERSWRRRLRLTLEEAREDAAVMRALRTVDEYRRKGDGNTEKTDQRQRQSAR